MRNILCYGDSNTWGYDPRDASRYPAEVRWTGVLAKKLGAGYRVIEDGINGRRTVWDDPVNLCRNGAEGLGYALNSGKPLDLVIVMLGTNDLNHTDATGYYNGLSALMRRVVNAETFYHGSSPVYRDKPRALVISPILLTGVPSEDMPAERCERFAAESARFAGYTERLARELGIPWLNAAAFASPSPIDGCHMDGENHRLLGEAVFDAVREIFRKDE